MNIIYSKKPILAIVISDIKTIYKISTVSK